jgi:tagatose-1,6-bisphosphate aldolase
VRGVSLKGAKGTEDVMAAFARFEDGVEVSGEVFQTLARFAPDGVMDVLACDQHNSVVRMLTKLFARAREAGGGADEYPDQPRDQDVTRASFILARRLGGVPAAALFNHLAYLSDGFREVLGADTMLIGRLESTVFLETKDKQGLVAQLAVQPEQVADRVDAFKTLVKVDPAHRESWDRNLAWQTEVWERCRKLGKPLFNETLYTPAGLPKRELGEKLPEALPKIARDFGPLGDFYKTQVPLLWIEDDGAALTPVGSGELIRTARPLYGSLRVAGGTVVAPISSPEVVRRTTEAMAAVVDRPLLLLSAAVNFEQYAAQYGIVCDLVAGPMCGRAYFKDPFADPAVRDWEALEQAIAITAVPRMRQIKALAAARSQPWWHKYTWMSDEARALIQPRGA